MSVQADGINSTKGAISALSASSATAAVTISGGIEIGECQDACQRIKRFIQEVLETLLSVSYSIARLSTHIDPNQTDLSGALVAQLANLQTKDILTN